MIAKEQLKQYIETIVRLEGEKGEINDHIKDVFSSAKSSGYDISAMKQVLRLMKLDKNKLAEQEAILELYRGALDL